MMLRGNWWVALIAAAALAVVSCKKEAAPVEFDPLESAIAFQGGLKALKAASSFSATYQATGGGGKIKGKLKHKGGSMRVEYVIPYGDRVVQAAGDGRCWRQRGQVVIPCDAATLEHTSRLGKLLEAAWLWPLKERKDLTVKNEKINHAGKDLDGLTILAGGEVVGTLLVDPTSSLVVGLKMQTTLMGKSGELVGTFSKFDKVKGVKIALKREYTFQGQTLLTETMGGIMLETLEDKLFEQPAQVKHGLVKLKHKGNTSLVCTKLKGPLSGVDTALGKVRGFIAPLGLTPEGAPYLIHHRAPPRVKRPAGYVTDVCLPVGKKSWTLPKNTWKKGKFTLEQDDGDEVLATFGHGDVSKTTAELPGLLVKGAKERGRKQQKVPLVQILHLHHEGIPAADRASEMHTILE